jgi:glutamate/tyrosine decarboxylase-like PLP-dependent enzyme
MQIAHSESTASSAWETLRDAADRALRYVALARQRRVFPDAAAIESLAALGGSLPEEPRHPAQVLAQLDRYGSPATVVQTAGRYFGFVNGGVLPASLAATWLAAAWNQNAALRVMSPVAAKLEDVVLQWLVELLGLPAGTGAGFVTGATAANFAGIAAARHALLAREGWDVERRGLFGAPEIEVVAGDEVHASLLKALSMAGLGRGRVVRVPADGQGRLRADLLPRLHPRTILCLQAGNVNTGAFDPFEPACEAARKAGAWVHVDGAFGLWALASPPRAQLTAGLALAHSWATDAHKWLNAGYDSGIAFVRDPEALRGAFSQSAAYLASGEQREPMHFTPESSRRPRAVEIWAALRSLGRRGVAELVERCCRHAARFALGLREAGFAVLNDVVLNQVLVSFGDADRTRRVIRAIQEDGACWCGGTEWQGHAAMRISVSDWATTEEDVERSLAAIVRCCRAA